MPNTYRRMDMKKTILVIEDDVIFSRSICNWLSKNDMITKSVTMLSAARKHLATKEFDLILADLRLPDGNSTELLRWMHEKNLAVPFLIMTNYGQVENAVEAMQLGAVNYLCKPVRPEKLLDTINKVFSHMKHDMNEFYRGESDKAREMYRQIGLVAAPEISVLLRGASGTGKEHIARELHEQSRRKNKPYITVDCGSILEELAASEFLATAKVPSLGPTVTRLDFSKKQIVVHCSLMKSGTCPTRPKCSFYVLCKRNVINQSDQLKNAVSIYDCWPLPMKILKRPFRKDVSERTYSTA